LPTETLLSEVTFGKVAVAVVTVGTDGNTTLPNYCLHELIALSYIRQIEKYEDIE
jgi:hypothetical protein